MITLEDKIKHSDDILDDRTYIYGQIYKITNQVTNKMYIGQVVSHRKNRNKYRPFGHIKRLDDHISEALMQTKKNECVFLNNSIRKYGRDKFIVELVNSCELEEIDEYEKEYIMYYNTLYPTGYNLTIGGKGEFAIKSVDKITYQKPDKAPYKHTDQTKSKIRMRLKDHANLPEIKIKLSTNAQTQFDSSKLVRFKNVTVDHNNLEQYIKPITSIYTNKVYYYQIHVDGMRADFKSKHSPIEELKDRAFNFLKQLPAKHLQLPKIKIKLKTEISPKISSNTAEVKLVEIKSSNS